MPQHSHSIPACNIEGLYNSLNFDSLVGIGGYEALVRTLGFRNRKMAEKKKKLTWEEYEKKISNSRTKPKLSNKKGSKAAPSTFMVQRMSSQPTGRLKEYKSLDTREFVDFTNYDEVTIDKIKPVCESHYNPPAVSGDVLLSDIGPSCYLTEQITNKEV